MLSQGFLFSEPSIAETGVWCQLHDGIDPADWAFLCRCIGRLAPDDFYRVLSKCKSQLKPANGENGLHSIPPVSVGPSGINGRYQNQWRGELL